MQYSVAARWIDENGSVSVAHGAEVKLATDMEGRADAMNPVELLLSALAACMIKGMQRVAPMLGFQFDAVSIQLSAERQNVPPKLTAIRYEIRVTTQESDTRLDLLHRNILKYGTISNTLMGAVPLGGVIRRV